MRILLLLFILTVHSSLIAQDVKDLSTGLELLHKEKRISRTIPLGTKVVLALGDERVKGVMESIVDTGLVVNGLTYPFRDITWIGIRNKWTNVLAVGVIVLGLGIATAGAIYVASASGLGFLNTSLIVAGGLGFSSLGVPILKNGKRYYLDSDWKVMHPGE